VVLRFRVQRDAEAVIDLACRDAGFGRGRMTRQRCSVHSVADSVAHATPNECLQIHSALLKRYAQPSPDRRQGCCFEDTGIKIAHLTYKAQAQLMLRCLERRL
jgi:hypothetical protein